MEKAKQISARILAGERIRIFADTDEIIFSEGCPDFLEVRRDEDAGRCGDFAADWKNGEAGESPDSVAGGKSGADGMHADIYAGIYRRKAAENTLALVPRVVTLGIGCRRGTTEQAIDRAVKNVLDKEGIFFESVQKAASIDLKADEKGLKEYCERYSLPFFTYSMKELQEVCGTFSDSEFVKKTTGVGNVCERSAVCAGGGTLLVRKQVHEGVTVAMSVRKWNLCFFLSYTLTVPS